MFKSLVMVNLASRGVKLLFIVVISLSLLACSKGGAGNSAGNGGTDNSVGDVRKSVTLLIEKFGQGTILDGVSDLSCTTASCSVSYDENQKVNLSTQPEDGWQLNSWSGCDEISNGVCTVTMTGARSVYPTFERKTPPVLLANVRTLSAEIVAGIVSIQDGAIVFPNEATDMATVPVGTVLISTEGEGFARKVTDVIALKGSSTTVATKNVPLEEVIGVGTIIYNTPFTNADLAEVASIQGVRYVPAKAAASPVFTFEVDAEVKGGVHVKGTVELEVVPDFALDIGLTGLQEFKAAAEMSVKPEITITVPAGLELDGDIYLSLPPMKFPIQVGPVTMIQEIKGRLKVTADATVETSMVGWVKVTSRAGAHYISSVGWKGIGEADVDGNFDPFNIQGKVNADVMVGTELSTKIYGVAGPAIFVGPYVAGSAAYDPIKSCGTWAITAGARASAKVEGKVLGWKIASADFKLIDVGLKLAGDEYGACSDDEAPSKPGAPVIIDPLSTSMEIKWDASIDNELVEKYEIYRDYKKVSEVSSPVYIDDALEPETRYCYYVVAVDSSNNRSTESGAACGNTAPAVDKVPPTKPSGLTAQAVSSSAVNLQWQTATDNAGDVSYLIFLVGNEDVLDGVEESEVTVTRLKSGTEYCFQVAALDAAGNISVLSDKACSTTDATGGYRMRVKCEGQSSYAVDTTMDLDENYTSNVSVVGSATDYGGSPMSYVLSGGYYSAMHLLDGRIDWSFEGRDCSRTDTFTTELGTSDTGDVTMNQVSVCGCTAQIRFTRDGSSPAAAARVIVDSSGETFSGK